MKITHLLSAVALAIFTVSFIAPTAHAAGDVVTVKHAPAKFAGRPNCASKYPAGGGQAGAFRHGLTKSCYSCPAGYKRSLNPNIKAADACVRTTAARSSWSKAAYKGKKTLAKPTKRAFKDPRRGGEWWECPSNRPRRTAYAVTDKRACATKNILGEKLSKATFLGKVNRSTPKGAFLDPRRGGEFWACPAGYKRTVFPVTNAKACEKVTAASTKRAKAKSRGTFGCKAGAFQNGLENACYTCPASYKRSAIPGTNLHKMKSACVYVKVDMKTLHNPKFVAWAKKQLPEIRRKTDPFVRQVKQALNDPKVKSAIDSHKKAKSPKARARAAFQILGPLRKWIQKAQLDTRKASLNLPSSLTGAADTIDLASATGPLRHFQGALGTRLRATPVKGVPALSPCRNGTWRCIKSFSVGWPVLDVSAVVGVTWTPIINAWNTKETPKTPPTVGGQRPRTRYGHAQYAGTAWSVGITAGADFGVLPEFGFWTDYADDIGGNSHGLVTAAAIKGGVAMSFWWNYEGKFLGFTVLPQVGASVEAEYIRGHNRPTWRSNPN